MAAFEIDNDDLLMKNYDDRISRVEFLKQLSVFRSEMEEIKQMMKRIEKRQNDGEEKLEAIVSNLNYRVDGVTSGLRDEANRWENVISDLQKRVLKSEGKSESYSEMFELNSRKNHELILRLKSDFENELKANKIEFRNESEKLERAMNENVSLQERKWTEIKNRVVHILKDEKENGEKMTSAVNKNASQMLVLNAQVERLGRDLQNQVLNPLSNLQAKFETMNFSLDELQKMMSEMKIEKKDEKLVQEKMWAEFDGRINGVILNLQEHSDEITVLKKNLNISDEKNIIDEEVSPAQKVFNSFIKPEIHHLRIVGEYYNIKPDFTWMVNDVKSLENGSQKELLSKVFPLRGYPFGAQAKITLYANSFQFYLSYKDINKTNRPIRIQPFPNIYLTLKDRSDNEENRDIIGTHDITYFKEKLEYNNFYPLYLRKVGKRTLNSSMYNADDKVVLDIHVESPTVAKLVYSYDGTLIWAIDNHSKRKQSAVDGLIVSYLSPYFYTHSNGYRVRVRVYLNGFDEYENKGLTVAAALLTGLYDHLLDEDFPHVTTVTVFDPTQPARNISKSVEKDDRNCYWINMGTHEEIEKLLYCDTLYYKVTVKANRH